MKFGEINRAGGTERVANGDDGYSLKGEGRARAHAQCVRLITRARQRINDDLSRSRISRRLLGRKWGTSFSKASFSPRWRGFRTEVTGHACNEPPDQRTVHTGCANKHAPSRLDDERGMGKGGSNCFSNFFFTVIFFFIQ